MSSNRGSGAIPKRLSSGGRLPSFRGNRDLTLSGSASTVGGTSGKSDASSKKKFTPNLNAVRKKKEVQSSSSSTDAPSIKSAKVASSSSSIKKEPKFTNDHRNNNSQKHKNNKNSQGKANLIQTMGSVFGEGFAASDTGIRRKASSSGYNSSSTPLEKPKLIKTEDVKFDKEAELKRLKELLRDDFVDDLKTGNFVPVQLPMVDSGKLFKEAEEKDKIATVKKSKNRILDSDDDDDDIATITEENIPTFKKTESDIVFSDLVKTQKGDLLFIQLPDTLPLKTQATPVKKEEPDGVIPSNLKKDETNGKKLPASKATLNQMSEGYLGKIQIRKSGKTQLVINDDYFDVEMGTQVGFLQDLMNIKINNNPENDEHSSTPPTGEMTVLGHVKHRVVITPDWEQLLKKSDNEYIS